MVTLASETLPGAPPLVPIMRGGCMPRPRTTLDSIREQARAELAKLPEPLRALEDADPYAVEIAPALRELAGRVDEGT